MSNMPDDILDEANRVLRQLNEELTMGKVYVVARALATERERCARIATEWHPDDVRPQDLYSWSMTANEIARAIRGSDV